MIDPDAAPVNAPAPGTATRSPFCTARPSRCRIQIASASAANPSRATAKALAGRDKDRLFLATHAEAWRQLLHRESG